ncbi:MAG: hypothetical protein IKW02_02310 [Clostridia bacterium]|nr:hypothetical protein [Clostridia bacterium]
MEKRRVKGSEWMSNKTTLKVVSLVLSIVLWSYVAVTQDPTRSDRVEKVEVICGLSQTQINQGLSIVSKSANTVSFDATGKRSLVTGVRGNYSARLDLDDITAPGKYNIVPEISRPDGVYIADVIPSTIEVYVDKNVSSSLPVVVETTGKLSDNLIITDMTADLSQIDVTMPSLALEQIAYAGAIVDLSEVRNSTIINCPTVLMNSDKKAVDIKNAVIDKKNVVINISVEQMKNVKISPKIKNAEKFAKDFEVTVLPKTIEICGEKDVLDTVSVLETKELALGKSVTNGEEFEVELMLPAGTHLRANTENKIKLIFNKK